MKTVGDQKSERKQKKEWVEVFISAVVKGSSLIFLFLVFICAEVGEVIVFLLPIEMEFELNSF